MDDDLGYPHDKTESPNKCSHENPQDSVLEDAHLVGGIPTPLKNMKVRLDHHPQSGWGK